MPAKENAMATFTVEEAQARLPQLLDDLVAGDEVVIVREGKPVGRLLPPELPKGVPILGRGKGKILRMIDDDEHLKDFAEYLE
jgi:antitoxin (DNA-binding transcriptional repressor) of toxin-antitoxin stability system